MLRKLREWVRKDTRSGRTMPRFEPQCETVFEGQTRYSAGASTPVSVFWLPQVKSACMDENIFLKVKAKRPRHYSTLSDKTHMQLQNWRGRKRRWRWLKRFRTFSRLFFPSLTAWPWSEEAIPERRRTDRHFVRLPLRFNCRNLLLYSEPLNTRSISSIP